MYLIVALGNPGVEYVRTRHNAGWIVVDQILRDISWDFSKNAKAQYYKEERVGEVVEWVKPETFMNKSGESVRYAAKKYDITPEHIIVIHDEMELPVGAWKISQDKGAGGHNGVTSIINHLHAQDFVRIRIGVGRSESDTRTSHVLGRFTPDEVNTIQGLAVPIEKAINDIIEHGASEAMNRHNEHSSPKRGAVSETEEE